MDVSDNGIHIDACRYVQNRLQNAVYALLHSCKYRLHTLRKLGCLFCKFKLRVVGVYRDKTEREALATGELLEQEYCVIITIRDPMDAAPVYDEVVRGLDQNNFWQSAIRLSNDVRIRQ